MVTRMDGRFGFRMAGFLAAAVLAFAGAAGCDSDSGDDPDAGREDASISGDDGVGPEVVNPEGKLHGQPCTLDSECRFARCISAPSVTGGAFKICSKDCGSGTGGECNREGADYTCMRFSAYSGDDLSAFCAVSCASAGDCPTGYTACSVPPSGTALKVCNAL